MGTSKKLRPVPGAGYDLLPLFSPQSLIFLTSLPCETRKLRTSPWTYKHSNTNTTHNACQSSLAPRSCIVEVLSSRFHNPQNLNPSCGSPRSFDLTTFLSNLKVSSFIQLTRILRQNVDRHPKMAHTTLLGYPCPRAHLMNFAFLAAGPRNH